MIEETAEAQSNRAGGRVTARSLWFLAGGSVAIALLLLFFGTGNPGVPAITIGPKRVKPQIVVSADRVLLLAPDGSLWTWGQGSGPHRLGMESDWQAIAASFQAFVGLKSNGSLWQWKNTGGFEGPPSQLFAAHDWRAVAAKQIGFAALKADGTLWSLEGSPVQLDESTNWVAVAGMRDYLAAVRGDGTLWVWGLASAPSQRQAIEPIQFGDETNWTAVYGVGYEMMARKRDGSCWLGGRSTRWLMDLLALQRPLQWGEMARLKEIESWHSVSFGSCALGLKDDGTLHGFGMNWAGILGGGPFQVRKGPLQIGQRRDWVAVGAGGWVAVGMTAEGSVWAWGQRVDPGGRPSKVRQTAVGWLGKLGYKMNGRVTSPNPRLIFIFRSPDAQTSGAEGTR